MPIALLGGAAATGRSAVAHRRRGCRWSAFYKASARAGVSGLIGLIERISARPLRRGTERQKSNTRSAVTMSGRRGGGRGNLLPAEGFSLVNGDEGSVSDGEYGRRKPKSCL